jgi:hypothetical protein
LCFSVLLRASPHAAADPNQNNQLQIRRQPFRTLRRRRQILMALSDRVTAMLMTSGQQTWRFLTRVVLTRKGWRIATTYEAATDQLQTPIVRAIAAIRMITAKEI